MCFLKMIDSISEWSGKATRWAVVVLIAALTYEVVARYAFNAPTIWAHEVTTFLLLTIVALGQAYTHLHHGHIRVDIIYRRFSLRGRAALDVVCWLLLFLPLMAVIIYGAFTTMMLSWSLGEVSHYSPWEPPLAPIKGIFLLGFCLFFLQSVAEFIRDLYFVVKNRSLAGSGSNA